MRLYEEIFKDAESAALCRCVVVPDGGGYIEGVKGVEDFSPQRVILRFNKWQAAIEGEGLFIKKYCIGDLELSGKIYAFYLMDGEGKPLLRREEQEKSEG